MGGYFGLESVGSLNWNHWGVWAGASKMEKKIPQGQRNQPHLLRSGCMSGKLPRVTAADVIKVLERLGFRLVRQSGSHKIYRNESGKRLTVSYHAGKILHPKVLKSILRDADLTVDEFKKML
jgi:predicted RNA binding protein YcfA (HicA-like mRNA interferase family)